MPLIAGFGMSIHTKSRRAIFFYSQLKFLPNEKDFFDWIDGSSHVGKL